MTRYYAAQRTFWVDPVSGTIVKAKEHGFHYYARDALKPEVTFADYTVTSTEETVESQVAAARDEGDTWRCGAGSCRSRSPRWVWWPWSAACCWARSRLRAESALIDPGLDESDHGFFGQTRDRRIGPMPAAEAQTEKLPTQRPTDLPPDRPV